ncbi:thioredoxin domain-containing protein [Candidatus Pacearchaeota archaeon]|nr:hypothetical protein [uncultured archaeon]MBS3084316.1 thioredoxin domain-containing protein [Candidatus Pacearchaeota archaeon]
MSETIQIKKDTFYKGFILVLLVGLIASIFTGGFGYRGTGAVTQNNDNNNNADTVQPVNMQVLEDPSLFPVLGPSNAKATIIELADYQCPYCTIAAGLASWTEQYKTQYGDLVGSAETAKELANQGKARFIYVPLSFLGQESVYAAEASYCAGNQGKYFEMHDAIFTASNGPSENDGKYSKANLKIIAQGISGLDQNKFGTCLDNDETLAKVNQATTIAQNAGFQISTPQFWVNEEKVQPSSAAIESAVNSA